MISLGALPPRELRMIHFLRLKVGLPNAEGGLTKLLNNTDDPVLLARALELWPDDLQLTYASWPTRFVRSNLEQIIPSEGMSNKHFMWCLFSCSPYRSFIKLGKSKRYISPVAFSWLAEDPSTISKWISNQLGKVRPSDMAIQEEDPPTRLRWVGHGLEIKKSTLEGCGNGLFATEFIAKNTFICEYSGEYFSKNKLPSDQTYIYRTDELCIDGYRSIKPGEKKGPASLSNHSLNNNGKFEKRQMFFMESEMESKESLRTSTIVYLQATKRIRPGEEIFTRYSNGFFKYILKGKDLSRARG